MNPNLLSARVRLPNAVDWYGLQAFLACFLSHLDYEELCSALCSRPCFPILITLINEGMPVNHSHFIYSSAYWLRRKREQMLCMDGREMGWVSLQKSCNVAWSLCLPQALVCFVKTEWAYQYLCSCLDFGGFSLLYHIWLLLARVLETCQCPRRSQMWYRVRMSEAVFHWFVHFTICSPVHCTYERSRLPGSGRKRMENWDRKSASCLPQHRRGKAEKAACDLPSNSWLRTESRSYALRWCPCSSYSNFVLFAKLIKMDQQERQDIETNNGLKSIVHGQTHSIEYWTMIKRILSSTLLSWCLVVLARPSWRVSQMTFWIIKSLSCAASALLMFWKVSVSCSAL